MQIIRFLIPGTLGIAFVVGCLTLTAGCGADSTGGQPNMVKDAPPLAPEQQKTFDDFYKNKKDQKQPAGK